MFSIMQNPPLSSYYIALIASFLGWSEPAMHGAFPCSSNSRQSSEHFFSPGAFAIRPYLRRFSSFSLQFSLSQPRE
jgi:hypothetical protein